MNNKYVRCVSCGEEIAETTNFCPNCGAKNENIITKCKSCGNVLTETDKFCPKCGTKRNKGNKIPIIKKLIILISLISLLAIGGIVIIYNDSEERPTSPVVTETTEYATEPEFLYEPDFNLFQSVVEDLLGSSFDYCGTSGDEANFYIGVANDGFADTILTAKNAGYDEDYRPWIETKSAMFEMYSTIYDTATIHGLHDIKITLMLLNDRNYDNALLIIQNGAVSYDFLVD